MKYISKSRFTLKNKCALFLLLFLTFVPLHAAKKSNYAEMGLALATIPFEIAAQNSDLKNKPKRAAFLHLAADSLSILNKILFLYNNIQAQKEKGDWTLKSRDCAINGILMFYDMVKWERHFKALREIQEQEENALWLNQAVMPDPLPLGDEKIEAELSTALYAWQVVVLPSLKGLTAFALACTQEDATRHAGQRARFVATAAHSLVNLLEEYNLATDSLYQKVLIAALISNTAWLCYELTQYLKPKEKMKKQHGDCAICAGEDIELTELHCGHACCRECMLGHLKVHYEDRGVKPLDAVRCCAHAKCKEVLTREEIEEVIEGDEDAAAILQAYDEACVERKRKRGDLSDDDKKLLAAMGTKQCPQCRTPIQKNEGCNHMTCRCSHEFCWICLRPYPGGCRGNCNFGFGGAPRFQFLAPALAWLFR